MKLAIFEGVSWSRATVGPSVSTKTPANGCDVGVLLHRALFFCPVIGTGGDNEFESFELRSCFVGPSSVVGGDLKWSARL
jgi:hypothetical protein